MKTKRPPSPLRLRRVTLGLTLQNVADALARGGSRLTSLSTVAEWEHGRPVPPDVAPILARILKVRRLP